jgi:non-heme chloroperoxidase
MQDRHPATTSSGSAVHTPPTPEELGLALRSISLPSGVSLDYVEKGHPAGETLLFLHGVTDSWRSWQGVLPLISENYRSIALSLRGHGESSRPDSGYTLPDFAADVIAFMDALGIEQATLVGHSMGSFVAQHVAARQPERVPRLVLMGSGATMAANAATIEFNAYVQTLTDPIDPEFVREFQSSTLSNPVPPSYVDTVVAESLKVPAAVWRQTFAGFLIEEHSARLSAITARTLILWGDRDDLFPRDGQEALRAALKHATMICYPETGHAMHWEHPERVAADIKAFLAETPLT